MKNYITAFLVVPLVCMACTQNENDRHVGLTGEWNVTWAVDGYEASGNIQLNADGSGVIFTQNDQNSPILPGSNQIAISWKKQGLSLRFVRVDNSFSLEYDIKSENNTFMSLTYADDIEIFMHRD